MKALYYENCDTDEDDRNINEKIYHVHEFKELIYPYCPKRSTYLIYILSKYGASQVCKWKRIHLPMQETQETWVQSLGQETLLEKEMAILSSISCLENSMDRGVWWAIVYGITKRVWHDWAHIYTLWKYSWCFSQN